MTTIQTAHSPFAPAAPARALNIALWTLQVLVALAFVAAALGKLVGSADMVALFDAVGIGQWFRYVTGSLEVLGAALLIVPGKTAFRSRVARMCHGRSVVAHLHRAPDSAHCAPRALRLDGSDCMGRRSQLAGLLAS